MSHQNFDDLYTQLATAWESHQVLRMSSAPLRTLADSAIRLDDARSAMWDWHRCNR